ncbi:MAG: hypothetical protein Kow0068_16420 [Marinilabiliales bacterium]
MPKINGSVGINMSKSRDGKNSFNGMDKGVKKTKNITNLSRAKIANITIRKTRGINVK